MPVETITLNQLILTTGFPHSHALTNFGPVPDGQSRWVVRFEKLGARVMPNARRRRRSPQDSDWSKPERLRMILLAPEQIELRITF